MSNKPVRAIGRFEIRKMIGKGMQGTVYLAWDTALNRLVAIKLMHATNGAGKPNVIPQQAQNVATLRHPHIVGLYEAGFFHGFPYLVFEYIEGCSLAEKLSREGAYELAPAVAMIRQIVEGIACAHKAGIVHLDLCPRNIMLEQGTTARIMDFDISERVTGTSIHSPLVGTLRYMAPEHFTSQQLDFRTDIYALGLIFLELLTGQPGIRGGDTNAILDFIVNGSASLTPLHKRKVPPSLIDLIETAINKVPASRYPDGPAMLAALRDATTDIAPTEEIATHSTIAFLLRRMQRKQDFPALSRTLIEINQLTSDTSGASATQLAKVILRDFAVTNKLLKLANSSFYAGIGRKITNVSDAIRILGIQQVRLASNTLLCFGHFSGKPECSELRDLQVSAFLAGLLARHLAGQLGVRDMEDAFICGMFHTLGKSLALFYFPEEYAEIKEILRDRTLTARAAESSVLGIAFEDLGGAVAREWRFPEGILATMRDLDDDQIRTATDANGKLHCAVVLASRLCAAPERCDPTSKREFLQTVIGPFLLSINLTPEQAEQTLAAAASKLREFAPLLDLKISENQYFKQLDGWLKTNPLADPTQSGSVAPNILQSSAERAQTVNSATPTVPIKQASQSSTQPGNTGKPGWLRRLSI